MQTFAPCAQGLRPEDQLTAELCASSAPKSATPVQQNAESTRRMNVARNVRLHVRLVLRHVLHDAMISFSIGYASQGMPDGQFSVK